MAADLRYGCPSTSQRLYLQPGALAFACRPAESGAAYDEYVSDPAKPVPYRTASGALRATAGWQRWLVDDQRFVMPRRCAHLRSEPLKAPLQIGGAPLVNLFASTSGTDSDWVVKLIDVYPDEFPRIRTWAAMSCAWAWTFSVAAIARASSTRAPIPANKVADYRFALPDGNHVFLPGHRIMVQVQSSWFPLYDRNPQTYVDNIFFARPSGLSQGNAAGVPRG